MSYIVRARLVGLDAQLEEASADLYATPLRTFRRITLPLAMPAVLAGGLLAFTLSLDNTIISAFVQVSGTTPWPVYVLSALRSGLRPEIAVSTLMPCSPSSPHAVFVPACRDSRRRSPRP